MGTGNDNNVWGNNANNSVFQIFEDAIAGALTLTVSGGTLDLSTNAPPLGPSQVRHAALVFNGTLASAQTVIVPNLRKFWIVQNATGGAFTLSMKTPSGSASAIPQNAGWQTVFCDGNGNIVVFPFNTQQIFMPDGAASAPSFSSVNETKSGWYRAGAQDWRLAINGADVLQVTGAGALTPSIFNVLSPNVLQQAGGQIIPPGTEFAYAGINLPPGGYLWEDGSAYSRSTYAALFSAITATVTGNTNSNTSITGLSADMRGRGLDGALVEGTGIPTGTMITFTGATTATLSQPAASSLVGITLRVLPYGQGDGSTTFNVPDRRGRVLAGRDDMNGVAANRLTGQPGGVDGHKLSSAGGEETHHLLQSELPNVNFSVTIPAGQGSHTHSVTIYNNTDSNWVGGDAAGGFEWISANTVQSGAATLPELSGTAPSGGSDTPHNNLQPTGVCNYIIKT